jgi:DNA-binding CsgD family transcriptional regulator
MNPNIRPRLLQNQVQWQRLAASMRLSPRQADIVRLVLQEMGDKQVAQHLELSVSSVRTHPRLVFTRLGVGGRVGRYCQIVLPGHRLRRCEVIRSRLLSSGKYEIAVQYRD